MPGVIDRVGARLTQTVSALVVDEIFDANRLDLAVVRLAAVSGIPVTVVGDPWQALYGFRGAAPNLVPPVIAAVGMRRLPLTRSFRWQTSEQATLADSLRASRPVSLPVGSAVEVDVVLAHQWDHLWEVGDKVLPTAFRPQPGNPQQAAATILLNRLTTQRFGHQATYLADAILPLQMPGPHALARLEPQLDEILTRLVEGGTLTAKGIWPRFAEILMTEAQRDIKTNPHRNYWGRLAQMADRARQPHLVPGMSVHQAKGREWSAVGVRMTDEDRSLLASGLSPDTEVERQLYEPPRHVRRLTGLRRRRLPASGGERSELFRPRRV
jgi:DNA helicase-2/ATP-dependent DNA helicase PcrA